MCIRDRPSGVHLHPWLQGQRPFQAEAGSRPCRRSERGRDWGAEVADLRLLCTDLRTEAAAARAEVRRQQSEFDQVVSERDQSRGRAAEAESRAGALAADLAVAQAAASEQCARAGGMSWLFLVFVMLNGKNAFSN